MAEIVKLLKQLVLADLAALVVTGVVLDVDKAARTIDVEPDDGGAMLPDVRLRSVVDGAKDGFTIWPVKGSTVTVLMLDDHQGLVVQYSAVEAYSLRTENESLKAILADTFDAIGRMVFQTNNGATLKLVNAPEFVNLKARSNILFLD